MHAICNGVRSMQQLARPNKHLAPNHQKPCPILHKAHTLQQLPATAVGVQRQLDAVTSLQTLPQHTQQQQHVGQQLPAAAAEVYEQIRTSSAQLAAEVNLQQQQQQTSRSGKALRYDAAAAALTRQMKTAGTWQDLMQLVQQFQSKQQPQQQQQQQQQQRMVLLNPQLLSCLLSAAVRLQPPVLANKAAAADTASFSSFLQAAFNQALLQLPNMQPRELSNIIWAACKLHSPPDNSKIKQLLFRMTQQEVLAAANAQDVSMCLYAAASLGIQVSQQQMEGLLAAAVRQLDAAAPQAVANILWGVAVLQYRPSEEWLTAVENTCCLLLQQQRDAAHAVAEPYKQQQQQLDSHHSAGFSNKGLHQLLWSMAKLQWVPESSFSTLFWDVTAHQLPTMTPHGTTGLLWAAATLEISPPKSWSGTWFESTYIQMQNRRLGDQDLALALWAVVRLALVADEHWIQQGVAAAHEVLAAAGSQELSIMLWSLAKLGVRPTDDWMVCWQDAMYKRMSSFCAPALACSAYSLAVLRYKPSQLWCQRLVAEMQRQMPAFGAQELANIMWAFAKLGLKPNKSWFRDFEVQALNASSSFNSQELSVLCWSMAKLHHTPPDTWVAALLRDGLEVQSDAEGQSLVRLMWALARWKLPEIRANGNYRMLLPRYWAASQQLLDSCSLWQLSVLWWTRVQLGCMPHRAWSNSFYRALIPALTAALQAAEPSMSHAATSSRMPTAVCGEAQLQTCSTTVVKLGCRHAATGSEQVLPTAVVLRLVSATSKMPGVVPPAAYALLFQAAKGCMPGCKTLVELAVLGRGLLRLQWAAARAAATADKQRRRQPRLEIGLAVDRRQQNQHIRLQRKASHRVFDQLVQKHAEFWSCWCLRSTQLLITEQQQLAHRQQREGTIPPGYQASLAQVQQDSKQLKIDAGAVTLQLLIASQLAPMHQAPSDWCEAVVVSVMQNMRSMSLDNLACVLWAAVKLEMLQFFPQKVITAVLTRCSEVLDRHAGEANSALMGRLNRVFTKLWHRKVLAQAHWNLWISLYQRWSSNHGLDSGVI